MPWSPYPARVTPDMLIMDRDGLTGQSLAQTPDDQSGTVTDQSQVPPSTTPAPVDPGNLPKPDVQGIPGPPPQVTADQIPQTSAATQQTINPPGDMPSKPLPVQFNMPPLVPNSPSPSGQQAPNPAPPQAPPQPPPANPMVGQVAQSAMQPPPRPGTPPAWRQILAAMAGVSSLTAPLAPLAAYGSKGLAQERAYQQYEHNLPNQIKGAELESQEQNRLATQALSEAQKAETARKDKVVEDQKAADAKEKADQNAAILKLNQDKADASRLEMQIAPVKDEANWQSKTDPLPAGWKFYESTSVPGFGFAAPSATVPAPKELAGTHLPGVVENQPISRALYKIGIDAYNKAQQAQINAGNKTPAASEPLLKIRGQGQTTGNPTVDAMSPAQARAASTTPPDPNVAAARSDADLDRKVNQLAPEHDKIVTSLGDKLDKVASARALLDQENMTGDALGLPAILTSVVGGQGSGIRVTMPELNTLGAAHGVKGTVESFFSKIAGEKTIPEDQRQQAKAVLDAIAVRVRQKQDIANKAVSDIRGARTRDEATAADKAARDAYLKLERSGGTAGPAGVPSAPSVKVWNPASGKFE